MNGIRDADNKKGEKVIANEIIPMQSPVAEHADKEQERQDDVGMTQGYSRTHRK
jgi:hypothetical protein